RYTSNLLTIGSNLKLSLDRLAGGSQVGLFKLKELFILTKPEHAGKNVGREDSALGVKVAHYTVVETAGGHNFVFGVGQFVLQLLEVFGGAQLRVGLGNGKNALERLFKLAFGLGSLFDALGLGGQRIGTGLGNFLEYLFFVLGVALHAFDQVRNQVV